jgi:aminoglycoside 6-adenylyltransferase
MRSDKEILDLLLNFAIKEDDIRAVIMNGSRVNPHIKKDPFQDFDVVYLVRDVQPFKRNMEVVGYFGDLMILQTPEDMVEPPPEDDGHYTYLMQFMDGNRIDLSFYSLEFGDECVKDSLSLVLLDKDHLIPDLLPPSDRDYLPKKPTAKLFSDCCNEFWWVCPYVAKGLWRQELTYAKHMLDCVVRDQFMRMLTWYVGIQTDFQKSPGKLGKYLKNDLGTEMWQMLEKTYADTQPEHIWESLLIMGDLFRQTAKEVAGYFNFTYPELDDINVTNYLHHIRKLPKDAEAIY